MDLPQAQQNDVELQPGGNQRGDAASREVQAQVASTTTEPLGLTGPVRIKLASAALCFFNAGVNDGSLGALIPYILEAYSISTGWMAIPYGVSFFGWFLVAIFGGYARHTLGSGGVLIVGASLQFLAQVLRFWIPPFGLFATTFFIVALGQALQDTQANTFAAGLHKSHRWLGLIHGCYATGGLIGPLIAASIGAQFNSQWAKFYTVPMGIGAINLILSVYAFQDETSLYQLLRGQDRRSSAGIEPRRSRLALVELRATFKQGPVWMLSIFFFFYLGASITVGGWVVEYLVAVRKDKLSHVGYISSAFYGGLAAGRFLLAEPTFRLGEKRMFLAYAIVSLVLQIIFWRVPNEAIDFVTVAFMGFLLGPAFATGVSVGSKLIPSELQASSLAMIFVMAQAGGAIFPAVTGVIAADAGVQTLQPILVGLLAATVLSWAVIPDPRKRST